MNYYVKANADRKGWLALKSKLLQIDGMYENFQLVVMPPEPPNATSTSGEEKNQKAPEKRGLLGRLFGGRAR